MATERKLLGTFQATDSAGEGYPCQVIGLYQEPGRILIEKRIVTMATLIGSMGPQLADVLPIKKGLYQLVNGMLLTSDDPTAPGVED